MRRLLLLFTLLAACGGSSHVDPNSALGEAGGDEQLQGGEQPALEDPEVAAEAFDAARAILYGEPAPAKSSALSQLPGRRVFLCAHQKSPAKRCATAVGTDLRASVTAAAETLKARADGKVGADRKDAIRLKLDVVTRADERVFKHAVHKPKKRDIGLYGIWVRNGEQVSWATPSEILEHSLFNPSKRTRGLDRKRVLKHLRSRNSDLGELPEEFPYTRLRTVAWAEGDAKPGAKPEPFLLFRLHKAHWDELSADMLLQRIVWAADYLASSVSDKGKIRYEYDVVRDRDSRSYNLLRHGGTTYSILQAYDRTRYEPYLEASKKALDYLFAECDRDVRVGPKGPSGDDAGESMYVVSKNGLVKLGGAGLALVAIDQYVEATGDTETYREQARGFARFLVASMKEDGEFIYFPSRKPGGPPTSKDDSAYYPGEAILGLIRLYSWDRNPLWLKTARDGADWLIDVRDKGKNEKRLANDHWLMLALSYLYHYTQEEKYLEHSLNLARAVEHQYEKNRPSWDQWPDYRGGYYDPPRSTPAATRGEGLGAVLDTCLVAKQDCGWVQKLLEETVLHENLFQYDPDMVFWVQNRAKTVGGWSGGIIDPDIRNDFVQHNMSSLIGLERHLRLQAETPVAGGPGWMEKALAGETGWSGLTRDRLEELQEATRRIRGKTSWEQ